MGTVAAASITAGMNTAHFMQGGLAEAQKTNARALPQATRRRWPTPDRTQERELVARAQAGDGDAFARLYEQTFERIYRYILFRVNDEFIAEDLTAEVFLRVWTHLPRYRPEHSTILVWIYTIAHNAVIDHYRTQRPTQPLDEAQAIAANEPSPHEQSELQFEGQAIRQAMKGLTPDQREVLMLRFLDGFETDEIASKMKKTPGAVRALQMRGLQMLARTLRDS